MADVLAYALMYEEGAGESAHCHDAEKALFCRALLRARFHREYSSEPRRAPSAYRVCTRRRRTRIRSKLFHKFHCGENNADHDKGHGADKNIASQFFFRRTFHVLGLHSIFQAVKHSIHLLLPKILLLFNAGGIGVWTGTGTHDFSRVTRLKSRLEFLHFRRLRRQPDELKRFENQGLPVIEGSAQPLCAGEWPDRGRKGVWHWSAIWGTWRRPLLCRVRRLLGRPGARPSKRPRRARVVSVPKPGSTPAPVPRREYLFRRGG